MIKLKGLYPSLNYGSGCAELSAFWFGNQLRGEQLSSSAF